VHAALDASVLGQLTVLQGDTEMGALGVKSLHLLLVPEEDDLLSDGDLRALRSHRLSLAQRQSGLG